MHKTKTQKQSKQKQHVRPAMDLPARVYSCAVVKMTCDWTGLGETGPDWTELDTTRPDCPPDHIWLGPRRLDWTGQTTLDLASLRLGQTRLDRARPALAKTDHSSCLRRGGTFWTWDAKTHEAPMPKHFGIAQLEFGQRKLTLSTAHAVPSQTPSLVVQI